MRGHWMDSEALDVSHKRTSLRGVQFDLQVIRNYDGSAYAIVKAIDQLNKLEKVTIINGNDS